MTSKEFTEYWAKYFPETPPINHLFKHNLKERWLRVHSLPEAKRYADTDEEWAILLERQNTIFNDLMPKNEAICIVSGIYNIEDKVFDKHIFDTLPYFKTLHFNELEKIDMFELSKDWYDEGVMFTPCFAEEAYTPNGFDSILKSIANDEWRLFFMDTKSNIIIAPYDGGMDIIFGHENQVAVYKNKYKNWLSEREDGM